MYFAHLYVIHVYLLLTQRSYQTREKINKLTVQLFNVAIATDKLLHPDV